MCNIDKNAEMALLAMGLQFMTKLMEVDGLVKETTGSTDVLATATEAYQQGKITKSQFMAVINALDETSYRKGAYGHPNNRAYLEATAYLNQYRSP